MVPCWGVQSSLAGLLRTVSLAHPCSIPDTLRTACVEHQGGIADEVYRAGLLWAMICACLWSLLHKAGGQRHTWQACPSAVRAARQCGCSSLYGRARRAAAEPCRTAGLLALAKP